MDCTPLGGQLVPIELDFKSRAFEEEADGHERTYEVTFSTI